MKNKWLSLVLLLLGGAFLLLSSCKKDDNDDPVVVPPCYPVLTIISPVEDTTFMLGQPIKFSVKLENGPNLYLYQDLVRKSNNQIIRDYDIHDRTNPDATINVTWNNETNQTGKMEAFFYITDEVTNEVFGKRVKFNISN